MVAGVRRVAYTGVVPVFFMSKYTVVDDLSVDRSGGSADAPLIYLDADVAVEMPTLCESPVTSPHVQH
jgi:hypothetical protein